jgi:hypothetical protein
MIVAPLRLMAGLLTVLALVLLLEWTVPGNADTAAPAAALHVLRGSPKITLATRAAGNWAAAVLDRPLFSISRRPPKVTAGPSEAAPDEARLAGILIGRFGKRAIFAPQGGGKPLVLAEGSQVNESSIRAIEADRVILASGAVLKPEFDRNRVPTAYTPPFQPAAPNFPAPGFVGGNVPQPGFPRIPQMPQPDGEAGQVSPADGQPAQPAQPIPMFRGPNFPNRRE